MVVDDPYVIYVTGGAVMCHIQDCSDWQKLGESNLDLWLYVLSGCSEISASPVLVQKFLVSDKGLVGVSKNY